MGHATASGITRPEPVNTAGAVEQSAPEAATKKITKSDFDIRWEWQRGRLQGQENYGYYVIISKRKGQRIADGFSSKRAASAWLGKKIKIANEIRQGRIVVERDENGRITGGYRRRER